MILVHPLGDLELIHSGSPCPLVVWKIHHEELIYLLYEKIGDEFSFQGVEKNPEGDHPVTVDPGQTGAVLVEEHPLKKWSECPLVVVDGHLETLGKPLGNWLIFARSIDQRVDSVRMFLTFVVDVYSILIHFPMAVKRFDRQKSKALWLGWNCALVESSSTGSWQMASSLNRPRVLLFYFFLLQLVQPGIL